MTTRDRARAHGVLATPARLEVLDHLRESSRPMDAREVAAAVGLHVTTVRAHLDALIEMGLVGSQRQPPKGRGRPRTLYAPSFREGGQGGDPSRDNPYRKLSDLLAAHLGDTPAQRADRARQAGHAWAAQLLDEMPDATVDSASAAATSPARARRVVIALFTEMGFDPEPAPAGRVLLHGCPFRDTARAHPEVVCGVHQGLLAGLLARLDPAASVPVIQPLVRPAQCVVSFGAPDDLDEVPGEPEAD